VETRLGPSYPIVPPETRILTPLVALSPSARRTIALSLAAGQHADQQSLGPSPVHQRLRVQAAWRWLACYEIWHETSEWPLPEAK